MRVMQESLDPRFRIEPMTQAESIQMISLVEQEGWNPGAEDGQTYFRANPNGLFSGRIDGKMIGCASTMLYGDDFAFFGMYIVASDFRKQGYGMALTRRCLDYAGDRAISLAGVIKNVKAYSETGFKPAYRARRFQLGSGIHEVQRREDIEIVGYHPALLNAVTDFDERYFPARRQSFLDVWLNQPRAITRVALTGGRVTGYIVLRPCLEGAKVGPLFAESATVARALLLLASQALQRYPVFIDVPEVNNRAMALAADLNMKLVWETLQMYTRMPREIELDGVYGLTNLEMG